MLSWNVPGACFSQYIKPTGTARVPAEICCSRRRQTVDEFRKVGTAHRNLTVMLVGGAHPTHLPGAITSATPP